MMRQWAYSWKSSDGLRHEDEMFAPSKDAVYAALRERGIRAIRVTERVTPVIRRGFRGLRKRDIWMLVVIAVVLVSLSFFLSQRHPVRVSLDELQDVDVERIAPDPASQAEIRRLLAERKAKENECRENLLRRVKEGTMTKETANGIFRATGLELIP